MRSRRGLRAVRAVSEQSPLCERHDGTSGDYQVIKNADIHETERIAKARRDQLIRLARFSDP